ncbi:hypothetical protein FO519_004460 [Halicephalobus sp. NKZ332]|nr:hypothetical protein FO519_004460 [Halicephalobus sp. NKZ332]
MGLETKERRKPTPGAANGNSGRVKKRENKHETVIREIELLRLNVNCCTGSGSFAARSRALGAANLDTEMRAAKCGRADFGIYRANDLRQLATIYEAPGDPQPRSVIQGGKLSCSFDTVDDDCAWYSVPLNNPQIFHRAGFETTLDLDRFDCTSDRSFPFTDHFLLVGGEQTFTEGSAMLETSIPCQYEKSTLKFDYWANNETPVLKICVIPEDTLEPNCEESKLDINPLTFEIPGSLKPFRIRIQIDNIGDSDIVLLDNVVYEGTICELVDDNSSSDLQKLRAEGTSNFNSDAIFPNVNSFDSTTSKQLGLEGADSTLDPLSSTESLKSKAILPDNTITESEGEILGVRHDLEKETPMDACKALTCSFNYGDACFYRLSGLGGTAAWKVGQGLLGNPHTGVHRHNPSDNKTSGFVYIGLDNNDFSSEVFVLESPRFRLSEPAYLTFDLYERSMGPQLKVCVNSLQDCPYSNPPLRPSEFWLGDQKVLLNSGSEKVYFIAGNVKQNLYLAIDNLRLQTLNNANFCPSNTIPEIHTRKKMARIVKTIRKNLGTRVDGKMVKKKSNEKSGRRRSDRIAKIAPLNGFIAKPKSVPIVIKHVKKVIKKPKVVVKVTKGKALKIKKAKVHTIKKFKAKVKTPRVKNDKLVPREGIPLYNHNPYLFTKGHIPSPSGVDALDSVRYAHLLVEQKDLANLKKLIANTDKFPSNGFNYGFSVFDKKTLIRRAFLKDDKKFLESVRELEKEAQKKSNLREIVNENCILKKMTTGFQNIHMLGHRTIQIEMTRGSRQGNNALILYDDITVNSDSEVSLVYEAGDDLDLVTIKTLFQYAPDVNSILASVRVGNRKLAADIIEACAKYYFNDLHINSLRLDNEPLPKFMPISTTKKAMSSKRITPVHTAAINPNVKYLKEILAVEPDFNQADGDNWYTVHYAAVCSGPEPLKYLIEKGAMINILNKHKESPLHCAARAGRVQNVKILLDTMKKAANNNNKSDEDMELASDGEEAPKRKRPKKLPPSALCSYLNGKSTSTYTPLHLAVQHGRYEVVKLLLNEPEIQVDCPRSANHEKVTPLMTACQKGDLEMVKILIDNGNAWIDGEDKFKRTSLIHATLGGQEHIAAELIRRGAGISAKPDSSKNSAAHYAAAYGWLNILKLLELAEPDCLSAKNSWHLTPLMVAFLKNHMEIVSFLLDENHKAEINVNDPDNEGNSILLLIMKYEDVIGSDNGLLERLNYLKEKKVDVTIKNSAGLTPLHYFASKPVKLQASKKGFVKDHSANKERLTSEEYFEILDFLTMDRDPEIIATEDEEGRTAFELALNQGNFLLAEALFTGNQEDTIARWKKLVEEGQERAKSVFHQFVDGIFTIVNQAKAEDFSVLEYQNVFIPFMKKIIEKIKNVKVKVQGEEKSLLWALASKYDEEGKTPLLKFMRRAREFFIPVATHENGLLVSELAKLPVLEFAKILIQIDMEFLLWRELDNQNTNNNNNNYQGGFVHHNRFDNRKLKRKVQGRAQHPCADSSVYKPNAFELALVRKDVNFSHSFKLLNKTRTMDNSLLKLVVDEIGNEKQIFEDLMMHQDDRFEFKGLSPLMFCIQSNLVDTVYYLLSLCEKFGLTEKVCSLTLEMVSTDGGITHQKANKSCLLLSIEKKQLGVAEYLMMKTNLAKTVDEEGRNAFHYLAQTVDNIVEFFEMLNKYGLPFVTDKKGRRPLHYAVSALQKSSATDISTDNLEFLLSADPNGLNLVDIDSRLPLHYAFIPFEETWKKKVAVPQVQVQVQPQQSAFFHPIANNMLFANLQQMMSSGSPNSTQNHTEEINDFDSRRILKSDPIAIVSPILKQMNAANLGKTDKYGNSVLHYAAMAGANICILTLLDKIKTVNSKNDLGNTPLALAVDNSHESATMTLIQAGANITDKFYGVAPKPVDVDSEKWKPWHMRSKKNQQREKTIVSLIVRNGWQGIIYIVLDKLDARGDQVLIELLAAALEYNQSNFAQTLLKKLKKVKNLTEPTSVVFESYAEHCKSNDSEHKLLEAMFDAGLPWIKPDGSSSVAEIFAKNCSVSGLGKLEVLDEKYNGKKNWNKLLKSPSAGEIVKAFLKSWNGNSPQSLLLQVIHYITVFAGSDRDAFSMKFFEFYKPAYLGMETVSKRKPDSEIQKVTALVYATQARKYGLMQFLITKLANVNDVDEEGRTPLMHALTCNDEIAVRILLKSKVDLSEVHYEEDEEDGSENSYVPEEASDVDEETEGSAEEDDDDSEYETPPAKKIKLVFKSKKKPRKEKETKKVTKTQLPQLTFKNATIAVNQTDKAGNNLMHYLISPNGYENVDLARKLIKAEPKLVSLLTKQNQEGESPLTLAAKLKQKLMFKELRNHLSKNQIDQKLSRIVEFESEADEIKKLTCPFDVDLESSSFIERQTKANKVVESEADKIKRQRTPHKNVHNADTSEIVQDEETKKLYKTLMHKTDVNYGMYGFHNYYRMQLVQRKRSHLYVLYTNWGRIGDETGQCQHTPFSDLESAVKEFKSIFKQKSGNEWDDVFVEKPGKYRLVQDEEETVELFELEINLKEKKSVENGESEGDKKVYELVKNISNVDLFSNKWRCIASQVMNNLPFGRIKKAQLLKAQEILDECRKLEDEKKKPNLPSDALLKILDKQCRLSNEFFMQIALGSFAFGRMTILENEHSINNIEKLVDQLWNFEVAAKLVTAAAGQTEMDAYKYIELGLESKLQLLDSESMEAQNILRYVTNSSAGTNVTGIYSVLSKSSTEYFEDSGLELHNHKLLWHGTKAENLLSILKVGLLAAPPHAQISGNLYGEGIYFSDTFEKSRGYCCPSTEGYYYALLCEVALGDVYEADNTYSIDSANSATIGKKHTLKILGQQHPKDTFEVTTEKGVRMPLGKLQERQRADNCYGYWAQYTEYIVKDRRNINIRYLVQFKQ